MHRYLHNVDDILAIDDDYGARLRRLASRPKSRRPRNESDDDDYEDYDDFDDNLDDDSDEDVEYDYEDGESDRR